MGQHHALRIAGRSRRVDQRREIVGLHNLSSAAIRSEGLRSLRGGAAMFEVGHAHVRGRADVVEADDVNQRGNLRPNLGDLCRLLRVDTKTATAPESFRM